MMESSLLPSLILLSLCLCLFSSVSVFLLVCPVCPSVRSSVRPSVRLSVCPSVCLSVCLSDCLCHYLSIYLSPPSLSLRAPPPSSLSLPPSLPRTPCLPTPVFTPRALHKIDSCLLTQSYWQLPLSCARRSSRDLPTPVFALCLLTFPADKTHVSDVQGRQLSLRCCPSTAGCNPHLSFIT